MYRAYAGKQEKLLAAKKFCFSNKIIQILFGESPFS